MKILLAAALLLTSLSVFADIKLPVDREGIIQYPTCSVGGMPIQYIRTNSATLSRHKISIAMAKPAPNGRPAVYFDRAAFAKFKPVFQMWVLTHECAHWQLGHIGKPGAGNEYMEREADCAAGKRLVQMGLSDEQLETIVEYIADDELMMSVGSPSAKYVPVLGINAYAASFDHRSEYVLMCMDEARMYRK